MTPELTDDQRHAIEERGGTPVWVVDAESNARYVLIRAEQYEQIKPLFEDDEGHPRELYPLVEQSFRKAGWDDPAMDTYDDYDAHHPNA